MKLTAIDHDPFETEEIKKDLGRLGLKSLSDAKEAYRNLQKDGKASKDSVDYSRGMKKSHCGICKYYDKYKCSKVRGYIDPAYWCKLFAKKERAAGGRIDLDDGGPIYDTEGVPSYQAPQTNEPVQGFVQRLWEPSKYPMEQDLYSLQTGHQDLPQGVALNEQGIPYDVATGQNLPTTYRPGILPLTFDPSGKPELAMPKLLDVASNIIGGPVPGMGGQVLGSGIARKAGQAAEERLAAPSLKPTTEIPHEGPKATPETAAAPAPEAPIQQGGTRGAESVAAAQRSAAEAAGPIRPIETLPNKPLLIDGEYYVPGPLERVHRVAEEYMKSAGLPYEPMREYVPVNVTRARAIARAFDEMKHDPSNPEVAAAYGAMIKETIEQLKALLRDNIKIEFIKPEMKDPYYASPRLAAKDVRDNNHLWVFPTDLGFGTEHVITDNPLLSKTGIVIDGRELLANDAFRIVHDYFGHLKDGVGFRAAGEENAWRSHSRMYSPLARRAMTTETRGQNSWLNYGPHGEANRTAKSDQTVFADQKIGILPEWAVEEGAMTNKAPFPQLAERYPEAGAFVPTPRDRGPGMYNKKIFTEEETKFSKERDRIREEMGNDYPRYFDPEKRFDVNPENYPTETVTARDVLPGKRAKLDIAHFRAIAESPEASKRLMDAYERGKTMPGARLWYAMGQIEKEFIDELGEQAGREAFKQRFGFSMAALTGGMSPEANLLASQYANVTRGKGLPYPTEGYQVAYPAGGGKYGITGGLQMHGKMMEEGIEGANPKRHNFAYNFAGHENIATIDEQMSKLFDPKMSLPPGDSYGVFEQALAKLAAKAGVSPREFQEVAWAGAKMGKEKAYIPHPMIETINRAIERTHRLTGMPRAEIVRRGLVRGEIPLYGHAGVPLGAFNDQQRSTGGRIKLTPVAHDPFATHKAVQRAMK